MASSSSASSSNSSPHAAARPGPAKKPQPDGQLRDIEVQADLACRISAEDGLAMLTEEYVIDSYYKYYPKKKTAAGIFARKLLRNQAFARFLLEVQGHVRHGRLAQWQVAPLVTMRLVRHPGPGALQVQHGQYLDRRDTVRVVALPPNSGTGGPRTKTGEWVEQDIVMVDAEGGAPLVLQVPLRTPPNEVFDGVELPVALRGGQCGSFPTFRALQQLAIEKEWTAYRALMENASGDAKELVDAIGRDPRWSADKERIRSRLLAQWRPVADRAGFRAPLVYLEQMMGVQTSKGYAENCGGCGHRSYYIEDKNLSHDHLAIATRKCTFHPFRNCAGCLLRQPHIREYYVTRPVLVAWQRGPLNLVDNLDLALQNFQNELGFEVENEYEVFAAAVDEFYGNSSGSGHAYLILKRGDGWVRACDGNVLTWDEPFRFDARTCLGFTIVFVIYIRDRKRLRE